MCGEELEDFLEEMAQDENRRIKDVLKELNSDGKLAYMIGYADAIVYGYHLLNRKV